MIVGHVAVVGDDGGEKWLRIGVVRVLVRYVSSKQTTIWQFVLTNMILILLCGKRLTKLGSARRNRVLATTHRERQELSHSRMRL